MPLINFWRSLEVPLINWKAELKLKWTKYCVLFAACNNNNINKNANVGNIIFTIKDPKLYILVATLSATDYQNVFAKDLKNQVIEMIIKQNVRKKIRQIDLDTFLNQWHE